MTQTIPIRAALGWAEDASGWEIAYALVDQKSTRPAWLSAGGERNTAIVSRALAAGLHLATLGGNTCRRASDCQASYRQGVFSVTSTRLGGALVDPMPLDVPPGWVRAAKKTGVVSVIVGDDIVELQPEGPGASEAFEFLTPAAARGALAMGSVPFSG
ncbi:hypothetical protein [Streptomyces sp. NPDC058247]|uniref:hypothetical protein n=1 Tax=Streptomyces sp. NPDC058247 TaxID=3346401 RepID=UPI0036E54D5D